jgi:hypothetical protein
MNDLQNTISLILGQVASLVKRMSDDEINQLLVGNLALDFIRKDGTKRVSSNRKKKSAMEQEELETLVNKLRKIESRKEGIDLLQASCSSKTSLQQVARILDIPTEKRDNIQLLTEKIIEATIGYRLRSRAIQGNSSPSQIPIGEGDERTKPQMPERT